MVVGGNFKLDRKWNFYFNFIGNIKQQLQQLPVEMKNQITERKKQSTTQDTDSNNILRYFWTETTNHLYITNCSVQYTKIPKT